jgi:hypothetical protein
MTRLHHSNALGSYPNREEFQIGQVIVWVMIPAHGRRDAWLERGDRLLDEVWEAIPAVLSAAQRESRTLIPEFWEAHDKAGTAGEQLTMLGIWIDPTTGSADYEVGCNHGFESTIGLPELPDGHSIAVSRDSGGGLLARG